MIRFFKALKLLAKLRKVSIELDLTNWHISVEKDMPGELYDRYHQLDREKKIGFCNSHLKTLLFDTLLIRQK